MKMFKSLEERMEYETTVGKDKRLNRYKVLNCDKNLTFPIEESAIDRDIFNQVCVESGCNPRQFKAELTGKDEEYWNQD